MTWIPWNLADRADELLAGRDCPAHGGLSPKNVLKIGSTHRAERIAKWNPLLQFEAIEHTEFAGPWPNGRLERKNT